MSLTDREDSIRASWRFNVATSLLIVPTDEAPQAARLAADVDAALTDKGRTDSQSHRARCIRCAQRVPLEDVAGMLRSLHYAAASAGAGPETHEALAEAFSEEPQLRLRFRVVAGGFSGPRCRGERDP